MRPTRLASTIFPLLLVGLFALSATAQTIQLPIFGQTAVSSTVSVPNRGGIQTGSFRSGNSGRAVLGNPLFPGAGVLTPRASWATRGAGSMSMHVWVHDLQAMDKALLRKVAKRSSKPPQKQSSSWDRQATKTPRAPTSKISRLSPQSSTPAPGKTRN